MFDEILACLKSKYPVDDDRVHTVRSPSDRSPPT